MCGFAGFCSASPTTDAAIGLVADQAEQLFHRGPDAGGAWINPDLAVGLGHRRLAIQDLTEAGSQPMHSRCGRFVIVFNGEIYNHLDLRRSDIFSDVERSSFKGHSDTETLVELIAKLGLAVALQSIRGMFSFAVWDQQQRELSLARDRMGEKPLYYGLANRELKPILLFGSELKALKVHPSFKGDIDRGALTAYLRHNYIPDPMTIYEGVYKLPPGCFLKVSQTDLTAGKLPEVSQFWGLQDVVKNAKDSTATSSYSESKSHLDTLISSAVKEQMLADVPVGAFLSGGIDSSLIVAKMASCSHQPINTFSIGFDEAGYNEAPYAAEVARHLGTSHTELYVTQQEARDVIPKLPSIYDEPFSDSSQMPTYLVSALAARDLKVVLTGDGGDELFCGYSRYSRALRLQSLVSKMPVPLRRGIASLLGQLSTSQWDTLFKPTHPFLAARNRAIGHRMHRLADVLAAGNGLNLYSGFVTHWDDPASVVIDGHEPPTPLSEGSGIDSQLTFLEQMTLQDMLMYLPGDILTKVDRAAMAVSLETRVPFLDQRVVEYSWQIPTEYKVRAGDAKYILKDILSDYVPKRLFERPKMGFGVPIGAWLRGSLKDWGAELLDRSKMTDEGFFNVDMVHQKWDEHQSGARNWEYHLWDILMFQQWYREQLV